MALKIIISIITTFILFIYLTVVQRMIEEKPFREVDQEGRRRYALFEGLDPNKVAMFAIMALVVGAIQFALYNQYLIIITKGWISILYLAVMIIVWLMLIRWGYYDIDRFKILFMFVLMDIAAFLITRSAAFAVASLVKNYKFWASIICMLPWILLVISVEHFVAWLIKTFIRDRSEVEGGIVNE